MKRLLFIAIIALISTSVKAQNDGEIKLDSIPVIDGVYQYQEVVNVGDAFKKDQLYKNAKVYFMDVFSGAKDAFQYDDKEEGRIIGKGFLTVDDYKSVFPGVAVLKWDVYYNVEITCKDGKYRYRVYDVLITREGHVAENNFRNVHLTVKDIYAAMPKQKGAYKTLYPKVMNKMLADLKTNITTLKESMVNKGNLTASF
jgi:hypothetical protein